MNEVTIGSQNLSDKYRVYNNINTLITNRLNNKGRLDWLKSNMPDDEFFVEILLKKFRLNLNIPSFSGVNPVSNLDEVTRAEKEIDTEEIPEIDEIITLLDDYMFNHMDQESINKIVNKLQQSTIEVEQKQNRYILQKFGMKFYTNKGGSRRRKTRRRKTRRRKYR